MPTRYVMVRFADAANIPYRDGVELLLPAHIKPWTAIAAEFPNLTFRRVFALDDAKPTGQATQDDDRPEPYFQVAFNDADSAKLFLERLKPLKPAFIEDAYIRSPVRAAHGTPGGGGSGSQGYLMAAPRGIDAAVIWEEFGVLGSGVTVAELDFGWHPHHDDLPALDLMFGVNDRNLAYHGTAVLGILAARQGGPGVRGGATEAHVRAGSVRILDLDQDNVPEALRLARTVLEPGDIILLEVTSDQGDDHGISNAPAEADPLILKEILRCAQNDILVIAPAGNSGANLHVFGPPPDPPYSLLVGACAHDGEGGNLRWDAGKMSSNYGERVKCSAWGHDILTLGEPPRGTMMFDGTSGAAAIVAVAAVLLQSIARKQFAALGRSPGHLTPEELCGYLSTYGTKINPTDHAHPMGVMPDLNRIVTQLLEKDFPIPHMVAALGAKRGKKGKNVPLGVVRKK